MLATDARLFVLFRVITGAPDDSSGFEQNVGLTSDPDVIQTLKENRSCMRSCWKLLSTAERAYNPAFSLQARVARL